MGSPARDRSNYSGVEGPLYAIEIKGRYSAGVLVLAEFRRRRYVVQSWEPAEATHCGGRTLYADPNQILGVWRATSRMDGGAAGAVRLVRPNQSRAGSRVHRGDGGG